jgi:hypothetical protein
MSDILNLVQYAIDETPEEELLPAGKEVEGRIVSVLKGTDKNGRDYIMPFFDIPSEPNVAEISKYMPLPGQEGMTEKDNLRAKRDLQYFGQAFDIDWSQEVELDSLIGKTGWFIVGVSPAKDDYAEQNNIRKFVTGA